jgi:hypothetical protein
MMGGPFLGLTNEKALRFAFLRRGSPANWVVMHRIENRTGRKRETPVTLVPA